MRSKLLLIASPTSKTSAEDYSYGQSWKESSIKIVRIFLKILITKVRADNV